MTRDGNSSINLDRANGIAQARTGGEMSVVEVEGCIQLCRKGRLVVKQLHPNHDMTEAGLLKALSGWEQWPANPA